MNNLSLLQHIAETRRSVYVLNRNLPVSNQEIVRIVEHVAQHTPSAFHSQSTRLVVLFGEEHEKLWDIALNALREIVPADKFAPTETKLNGFKAAAGSILFFEDQTVVQSLQEKFPSYAANFPVWADHSNAMHQYALWTALAAVEIGANLQHYNPLIDAGVAATWNIPAEWTLRAQLVFGGISSPAGEKTFQALEERVKVYGV
ncbi:MAG: nitroreductase family protein [Neisseria sp.]|nr:nitroreductase family protein [Neisseria sp.]